MPIVDITPPGSKPTGVNAPGIGVPQPTPEQRAEIEATWTALRDAPKVLAQLILIINAHPELVEWAKASQAGTLKV